MPYEKEKLLGGSVVDNFENDKMWTKHETLSPPAEAMESAMKKWPPAVAEIPVGSQRRLVKFMLRGIENFK